MLSNSRLVSMHRNDHRGRKSDLSDLSDLSDAKIQRQRTRMKNFRYDTTGKWYKGNVHLHTRASDGGNELRELAELYASAGYDFLFCTDHGIASDFAGEDQIYPLLWMEGIEIDGEDREGTFYHVVCLGTVNGINSDDDFEDKLASVRRQGALLMVAHPFWSGNTLADCLRWDFDAVEIYNHLCHWLNGKSDGMIHWHALLESNPNTLAFASDDIHSSDLWQGGWIHVNARKPTRDEIVRNIRSGNFYSSCGPRIDSINLEGDCIHVETSPVQFARLVGPADAGDRVGLPGEKPLTELCFKIPEKWPYVYVEIEDENGKRAWTNCLFKH